ncbi:alkaline phosphatase, tissue-nonspecific isozyme-like [Argopecten irradians]|uniref:alkaline phosphatase, tissue-nonspecific isozyme-like n=1 Tax=Argopecten irradians TaxID=31199 RepID=UPI003710CCE5
MSPVRKRVVFLSCLMSLVACSLAQDAAYWNTHAQDTLKRMMTQKHNTNVAKNVILFLGDGLGISTVTAARIYRGQLRGETGEENIMAYEKFAYTGFIKTYNTDQQVPDSAGTGTAFLCGVKAKAGTLGLDDRVAYGNCTTQHGTEVTSILDWSKQEGKSTGIVTTTRVTHATPAAAYAHAAARGWEGDTELDAEEIEGGCRDIAYQLVMNNSEINVILGGGRRYFLSENKTDPELNSTSRYQRADIDLVDEWIKDKTDRNRSHSYVWNNAQFGAVDPETTDHLLGLFESSHMDYEHRRNTGPEGEPSLAEMTRKAIQILDNNPMGFFLLVEGGRIDHAHHGTYGARALHETFAFEEAIQMALNLTNEEETLLVVTADHSHVFMMAGYPSRGNSILGLVDDDVSDDGMPYTTLVYGNGPVGRENLTDVDTSDFDFQQGSAVPLYSETHSGEDVPVYANGPMAHLLTGTHEQSYIPHVMAFASCVGINKDNCKQAPPGAPTSGCEGTHGVSNISVYRQIYFPVLFVLHVWLSLWL